jgi:ankyrin repeat protein
MSIGADRNNFHFKISCPKLERDNPIGVFEIPAPKMSDTTISTVDEKRKKQSLFNILKGIKKHKNESTISPVQSPSPDPTNKSVMQKRRASLNFPSAPLQEFVQNVTNGIKRLSISNESATKVALELKRMETESSDSQTSSMSSSKRNSLDLQQKKSRSKSSSPNYGSPIDIDFTHHRKSSSVTGSPDLMSGNSLHSKNDPNIAYLTVERRISELSIHKVENGSLERKIGSLTTFGVEESSYGTESHLTGYEGQRDSPVLHGILPDTLSRKVSVDHIPVAASYEDKSELERPRSRRGSMTKWYAHVEEDLEQKRKQKITDLLKKKSFRKSRSTERKFEVDIQIENGICILVVNGSEMNHCEALVLVSVAGEYDTLAKLLKVSQIKSSLDQQYRNMPPLHHAAQANQTDCVELLISSGASVDLLDKVERTALHMAVSNGANEASVMLLAKGATPNVRDRYGNHPLQLAVKSHHFDLANDLILFGADINFKKNDGSTILHEALLVGDISTLEYLATLSQKINVNIKDSQGETPLFKGVARDKMDNLKFFIRNFKPKLTVQNDSGQNIFHIGVRSQSLAALQYIASHDLKLTQDMLQTEDKLKKQRPIHYAVQDGKYEFLVSFLELPQDVNAKDIDGNPPLHYTNKLSNADLVYKLLLMHGAKKNK